jgi:hypothetical protein
MSTTPNIPPVAPETPEPSAAATPVANKRTVATGAIPKQMQSWIFLGIIAVVAIGLWFSGMGKKTKSTTGTGSATAGQVKPVVGGLTPDEVQKRLQESEDTRRSEAVNSRPAAPAQLSDARLEPGMGGITTTNPPTPPSPPLLTLSPRTNANASTRHALLRISHCLTVPMLTRVIPRYGPRTMH